MAKRILEAERNEIIVLYVEVGSINQVSKRTGRSLAGIKTIIDANQEKIHSLRSEISKTLVSPIALLKERMKKLNKVSELSLNRIQLSLENPLKFDVNFKDMVIAYKMQTDIMYQLKSISLKERECDIKERMYELEKEKWDIIKKSKVIDSETDDDIDLNELLINTLQKKSPATGLNEVVVEVIENE